MKPWVQGGKGQQWECRRVENNAPGLRFALDIHGCHWSQRVVFKTRV